MIRTNRDNRWFDKAACKGMDADIFYPPLDGVWENETLARTTCAGCPVRVECIDHALGTAWPEEGYWGSTKSERAKMGSLWKEERPDLDDCCV